MNTASHLLATIDKIKQLREIKKRMDIGAGITITVRNGCNPEYSSDDEVHMNACYKLDAIMDLLITEATESLEFWVASMLNDREQIQKAQDAYTVFCAQ